MNDTFRIVIKEQTGTDTRTKMRDSIALCQHLTKTETSMNPTLRRFLPAAIAAMVCSSLWLTQPSAAATYPDRPIRVVIPYGPGGNTDITARIIAEDISKSLNTPVVVENRPGSGVTLGTEIVAKAPADGYTLLITTLAHSINQTLYKKLPYDSQKDFLPIALVAKVPLVLTVDPRLPIQNQQDLINLLHKNPDKHSFASSGIGSPTHVAGESFKIETKTSAVHAPYKGEMPGLNDVIGGHVTFAFGTAAATTRLAQAGSLRALSIASAQRSALLPDVPTTDEAGLKGFQAYTWTALLAPAGTPGDIVKAVNQAVNKALTNPEIKKRLTQLGAETDDMLTPEATRAFMDAETSKWGAIVTASGATVD